MSSKTIYECSTCGSQQPKWSGQCPDCQSWNTFTETVVARGKQSLSIPGIQNTASHFTLLSEIEEEPKARFTTGLSELDHVLGGGIVPGSVVLIGGDPGIGKSTLLIESACFVSRHQPTVYVTGEESLQQISARARRLGLETDKLLSLSETNLERLLTLALQAKPKMLVVDSIQTVYSDTITSAPGSVSQVRECTAKLVQFAKREEVAIFLVGHVTKEGTLAGPRVLEHMVDTVLYFEGQSENTRYRMIRAFKNRFGSVNELGIFAMTEKGLKVVQHPSSIFLSRSPETLPGSAVMVTWEGSRPLLVEIQALLDESHLANPRRLAVGLDSNRLAMLLAVLHRHGGVVTYNQDVFVNVVGGIRVLETAADLALILSVVSSLRNKSLPNKLVTFGEVGLAGEIRPVPNGQERIKEAVKHGFTEAIIPKANMPKASIEGMQLIPVQTLSEALAQLRERVV